LNIADVVLRYSPAAIALIEAALVQNIRWAIQRCADRLIARSR
jgi:hypothetical protein